MFGQLYKKYLILESLCFFAISIISGLILGKLEITLWETIDTLWKIVIPLIWIYIVLKSYSGFYKKSRYLDYILILSILNSIENSAIDQKERELLSDLEKMLGKSPTPEVITFIKRLQMEIKSEQGKGMLKHILIDKGYSNYVDDGNN